MSLAKVAYTAKELAELAHVTKWSMYSRIKKRNVPHVRHKRLIYVAREFAHLAIGEDCVLPDSRPVILAIESTLLFHAPDYQIIRCTSAFDGGMRLSGLNPAVVALRSARYVECVKPLAPGAVIIVDDSGSVRGVLCAFGARRAIIDRWGTVSFDHAELSEASQDDRYDDDEADHVQKKLPH